ncbi:MAG: T9SS type A sorting domain-containing protein, partial [Flavobacteriaceae bacterium]
AITSDADLTAAAEVISEQDYSTGASEYEFNNWTAYDFKKSAFDSAISVGDGTLTYISTDTSWTGDVSIAGKVVVQSGATLTIAAGTVVKAAFANDAVDATALVVARGGKIEAAGTAALPIVFTTEFDDLTAADVAAGTYVSTVGGQANDLTTRGMWGGIIVLGNATVGTDNGTASIEGIAEGFDFTTYGNATPVDNENSGTMTYLSIRHGGATIANGDEINGLTLGGVGSGTTINHIEIISNDDDGIEFFGGTVDVDHLLIFNQTDDAIDIDQDYSGTVTNAYVAMGADSDNVFEIDGNEKTNGTEANTIAHAVTNVTAYQEFDNSLKLDQYGHWKSNAKGTYTNVVYKGFATGTRVEGVTSNTAITFSNFDFVTSDALSAITSDADLTAAAEVISEQALGTGANESEFNNWTAYDFVKNTLSFEDILNVQSTISFYPNPTNGVVNIDSETRVNEISVYAITGQLVKKAIGANSINIEEVRPGIYIIEVSTNEQKVQGKLIRK